MNDSLAVELIKTVHGCQTQLLLMVIAIYAVVLVVWSIGANNDHQSK